MTSRWMITTNCLTCDGAGVVGIEYMPVHDMPCPDCEGSCQEVTYEDVKLYSSMTALHLDYPPDKIVSLKLIEG